MSRLVLALASAFAFTACASDFKPLPADLDPSNPEAPEAPPLVASTTLSPPEPARQRASTSEHGDHGEDAGTAQIYACPMHPEVRSDKPGRCPKCGMDLELQSGAPAANAPAHADHGAVKQPTSNAKPAPTVYTCPMHPEVRSDQPGRCPKCGMTLVPVKPAAADAGTAGDHRHHGGNP